MGSDKHFHEDHCYLDDPGDSVGMNVEIIEQKIYQLAPSNVSDQKQVIRYIDISGSSKCGMSNDICEETSTSSRNALVYYNEYCTDHTDMFLLEDEKLVKPGDKFDSHDDFVQYLNENAKRWYFYYKCSDSRKPNTEYETYTYNCVYLRNKEKYKKKGLRKRNNNAKTDCPCKIKLRHLPNEKELTVVYVCNHHDHELSLEEFFKLQHGRRLPPYIKEEIMDFLQLKLDVMKIRAYVEMETGLSMSRPFFYALEKNLKSRSEVRQITAERLMMLKKKIAAVNEMHGFNDSENTDDQAQHIEEHAEDSEASWKSKHRRSVKNTDETTPPLKRRSKANDVVTSSDDSKRSRLEGSENSYNNETFESVKLLQESVKCEIQSNPWVTDQCVPVLPNRTAVKTECEDSVQIQTVEHLHEDVHSEAQNEIEPFSYTIEYYNPDESGTHEIISNEFGEIINDGEVNESEENDIDNIAYETVVTEVITENEGENIVQEYVNDDHIMNENAENQIDSQDYVNDHIETTNDDVNNTQDVVEEESHVDYVIEDNDEVVQYIDEIQDENNAQDVAVQTANSSSSEHSVLPVFDVYMKDGNVTGFVVNNNMVSGLKYGVDIGIQTSEESIISETQDLETEDNDGELTHDITNSKSGDTYTTHEYVHNYNIHKYMVQPHFPKYVKILAKKTHMDVLTMFTNIYNEKAMFKITTTQKGKEGNTRIWYITDIPQLKRQRTDEAYREKMGQHLESAIVMKEKVRMLKKHNRQLLSRNKKLEDVALRLVKLA